MPENKVTIQSSVHPSYLYAYPDWTKFRFVWDGGTDFRDQYLESYSTREDPIDFDTRRSITPIPGFASAAVTDIKNAIFQRMSDITRVGSSKLYHDVIAGKHGGVDLRGATMNYFIGNEVLPELLFMGKVGVYVDMPVLEDKQTLSDTKQVHPYYYVYKTEDIRNWRLSRRGDAMEFDMLLLRENILTYDNVFSLPDKDQVRYRLLTRQDGIITVRFYDDEGVQIDINGEPTEEITELNISRIPFTLFELNKSLLKDVADHQIALLNMESADVAYTLLANFPFYIEEQSKMNSGHLKSEESEDGDDREIAVGGTVGRSYGQGLNPPGFIHPSSEPLMASINKQQHLKEDIRTLVQLALSSVQPKYASAEAKQMDEHGLESGLSFIGLILAQGERQLSADFNEYEDGDEVATIHYPERYALKSDMDRMNEADKLYEIMLRIPSKTAQKEISQIIAGKILDTKIPQEQLDAIRKEIEDAEYVTTEPQIIHEDIEKGLVSTMTGSKARGYDAEVEVPKAADDHAARILRIKEAQTSTARGVGDLEAETRDDKTLSQNSDLQDDTHKPVRGAAS